jgi:hypothetical protein
LWQRLQRKWFDEPVRRKKGRQRLDIRDVSTRGKVKSIYLFSSVNGNEYLFASTISLGIK